MKRVYLLIVCSLVVFAVHAQEEIFTVVDEMPIYKGCLTHLDDAERTSCTDEWTLRLIRQNIRYPESLLSDSIEGKVYVSYVVNKEGRVTSPEVLRGIADYPEFSQEAVRVISSLPLFMPGKKNGSFVNVKYVLPIQFKVPARLLDVEDEIFTIVEDMPIWISCQGVGNKQETQNCTTSEINQFIKNGVEELKSRNLIRSEIRGEAAVRFIIDQRGLAKNPLMIISSGDKDADSLVVSIVNKMPALTPGYQRGKAINVQYTFPVKF